MREWDKDVGGREGEELRVGDEMVVNGDVEVVNVVMVDVDVILGMIGGVGVEGVEGVRMLGGWEGRDRRRVEEGVN